MKTWILKFLLFVTLSSSCLCFILFYFSCHVKEKKFHFYETDSNFLVLNENETFDFLFTGISHARNFSRHKNHLRVEEILNGKIANIGQGGATTGAAELLFYQQMFYRKGNTNKHLVYFISPPLFYSQQLRMASNSFDREPFEVDFFLQYLFYNSVNKEQRLLSYIQSKLSLNWYNMAPQCMDSLTDKLQEVNGKSVENGLKSAYETSDSIFEIESKYIEEAVNLSLTRKERVTLILPPVLFEKWPGQERVIEFAKQQCKKEGVDFYNFSAVISDPKYYYDHHHLNSAGVSFFSENYLARIIY